ncbi:glutamine--fructose-6-phosphate transaminase (isomerizing) [Pasteurella canis]|uniref:Glutamine--fructose-6-phosphate aminotransferase [isomerizing] n=1 Tax=Pasteurella canis TaxID=753 RepID=A0ABQ4VHJ0_9PAST|nr:glutamine--fructose-6-phosphate transaminase (isomerizing) [Pasteurella canis]UAX42095.1 glutamine--fructose-6-phosphate transaminase (isomerizing) [Pasteurella canis]UEC23180.1 glutamine--fructose-6-phosphate transaminase (isomerizing) [Pasteurella canis]GJH42144.1 glutamine--fructose-6-phosphate aminotransferase [isomerizing] [Pasteurella canis]
MCGIVGAVSQRDITSILVNGLHRLEYRGYDSAGIAVVNERQQLQRLRCLGKVNALEQAIMMHPLRGGTGIAHTRWATHGRPSEDNAHPHVSENFAVVHNGIIENYQTLRIMLQDKGYFFQSQTDTEVIAHLVAWEMRTAMSLLQAVQAVVKQLKGTYAIVVMDCENPRHLIATCSDSPLVIGLGHNENFFASDQIALVDVAKRFIFLQEGDMAEITSDSVQIYDLEGKSVEREQQHIIFTSEAVEKGEFRHFMQKEIFEQPTALINTMAGRISHDHILLDSIGHNITALLEKVEHIQIVACGTSYHAGMVARYWCEELAGVSCDVEIASEFRYRQSITRHNSLFITLSQSGETADTLAALRLAKTKDYLGAITICNVAGSTLVRESDFAFMTHAGVEIGVASTKAFTTQLVNLLTLVSAVGKAKGSLLTQQEQDIVQALKLLPTEIENVLALAPEIENLAQDFVEKQHVLFLGRGEYYPIMLEAALKLKEISYIHAEAYAAGELKHGPLALVDKNMPVIIIAPSNELLEKVKSNIEEVRARGGQLYIFTDDQAGFSAGEGMKIMSMPKVNALIAPIFYIVPLQLLAYYVALIKGADVDQPRNLAKAVTVE